MTTDIPVKYFTINSFINSLNEKLNIEFVHLYFIPSHTFRNQFNNISIKPIAMLFKEKDNKPQCKKYNDMIDLLGCLPIISFKPSNDRRIYKNQQLQKLIIYNEVLSSEKGEYHISKILTVNDDKVINSIKADLPEQDNIRKCFDDGFDNLFVE